MRADALNWHGYGGYTEMTAPSLNINDTDEDESEHTIVHKGLSENFSTDVSESKQNTINKTWSQKNSADVSDYTITELKDNEYKEPSDTK